MNVTVDEAIWCLRVARSQRHYPDRMHAIDSAIELLLAHQGDAVRSCWTCRNDSAGDCALGLPESQRCRSWGRA